MRSRYNPDGSIDYEADRELEMLRLADQELERLRREEAETGEAVHTSPFKKNPKAGKANGVGDSPYGVKDLFPLPLALQPPTGIPDFLKPSTKS